MKELKEEISLNRTMAPRRRGRSPTSQRKKSSPSWMKKKNTGEFVLEVLPNDVLFGRGSGPNVRKGNIQFRELIKERKQEYLSTNNRRTKLIITSDIISKIYEAGGRFLKKLDDVEAAIVLPKVLERLGKKQEDNFEDDFDNHEPTDVYEIQGAAIVMEKTKQALRQNQQKGPHCSRSPNSRSPYSSRSPTGKLSPTRTPPNGFIGTSIGGDLSPNGFSRDFNDWNNVSGSNGLSNNNRFSSSFSNLNFNNNVSGSNGLSNNNRFSSSLSNLNFNNKEQSFGATGYNNKFSSSLGNLNVSTKEEEDIAPTPLPPTLYSNNQQQQQRQDKDPNTTPTMSLQQQLYQLEQQQQLQEKQHQLEKKQFELQRLELERQKQSLQQNLALQLQQDQLRRLQELQQLHHRQCNNQNSSRDTNATNNNEINLHYSQQQRRQQQQERSSNDFDHKKQQQHHNTQQDHKQQQQDQLAVVPDGYSTYTTTLEEMGDAHDGTVDPSSNTNKNNDKRNVVPDDYATYTTTLDEMGDARNGTVDPSSNSNKKNDKRDVVPDNFATYTTTLEEMGDARDGAVDPSTNTNDDKSCGSISTMMLSMKDLSVQDCELQSSHSSLGTIDGISDNVVGKVLSDVHVHLSGVSMMSMKNDSMDSLFRSKRLDSSKFGEEASKNSSWDDAAGITESFNRVGTRRGSNGDHRHDGNGLPTRRCNSNNDEQGCSGLMGEGRFNEAKALRILAAGAKAMATETTSATATSNGNLQVTSPPVTV